MSELRWNWVYYPYLDAPNKQEESALKAGYIKVVIKDEADAVIKELKAQKAQAEDDCAYWKTMSRKCADDNEVMAKQRADAFKRERHHKYKRCLAMAKYCESEEKRLEAIAPLFDTDKECWEYGSDYWKKWHKRWLQLAEQVKTQVEAK